MESDSFTVVITTYNRAALAGRAIRSALGQDHPESEVIVVDDASSDETPLVIPRDFPGVRFIRQPSNCGPQVARNRGIEAAAGARVLILDDDDELLPRALWLITQRLRVLEDKERYPVVQFARTNGYIPEPFMVVRPADYLHGRLRGDFTPVIHRERFLAEGLAYPVIPELRGVGCEHLLWWKAAARCGIPTWREVVVRLHGDAPIRLTSTRTFLDRACSFARMQEVTLGLMKEMGWDVVHPDSYAFRQLAAAAYWLVAGERGRARSHLRQARSLHHFPVCLGLWGLSLLPGAVARVAFEQYKNLVGKV